MARKAAWIVSILLLLNTGGLGLYNGLSELSDAHTSLQLSVTVGVLIYGILGLAAAAALIVRNPMAVWISTGWAVVVTYVASTAAIAYARNEASVGGALAGGLGAALIGVFVIWCSRTVTRPATLHERLHASSSNVR
jgi:predicted acyltransferase